ncbi:MAG TPA: hypothetical protein VIE36_23100 [Methylomirabilota bacterium]|jgi:hypothetical protein
MKRPMMLALTAVGLLLASGAYAERAEDIQAPRGQEIQAPRGEEIQAPRQ